MKLHVQIVDQLSKFNLWNKDNKIMELMYNAREKMMNILSCVDFVKLCHTIKYFRQLNQNFGKEYINLSLSSCSRNIRQRKNHNDFELGFSNIDTRMYLYFTIDKKILQRLYFYNRKTNQIYTCSIIQKTIYTTEDNFYFLCLKSPVRYYFYTSRIITLFYRMYIEYKIHTLTYNTRKILYVTVNL